MAEPQSPEIKISKNPVVQSRVEGKEGIIEEKFPNIPQDVKRHFARQEVSADIRRERQKIETNKLAMIDPLTGMRNRRWFDAELKMRIAELNRVKDKDSLSAQKPLWLLYFDLDRFKDINTQYGEPRGGDHVLRVVAGLPSRTEEPIARLGGEEFGELIDEEISEDQLAIVIGRYMGAMQEKSRIALADRKLIIDIPDEERVKQVTISYGLTKYIPGDSPESLVERANLAMRHAKSTGRNKAVISENTQSEELIYRDLVPIFPN